MASVRLLKLRAFVCVCVAVLGYPFAISLALLHQLYKTFCCRKPIKNIAGEITVITGGACGLGKEVAIELAAKGCQIAIADIDQEQAEATANYIGEVFGVKAKAYKVDVTDYEQVMQLSKDVTADFGATDILINNAGIALFEEFGNPNWPEVQKIISTNLISYFATQQAFLPQMKAMKKGHIVAMCSASSEYFNPDKHISFLVAIENTLQTTPARRVVCLLGFFPLLYNAEYTATKFGVRGLTRVLRLELKLNGFNDIHVTTVFASFLDTNKDVAEIMQKTGLTHVYPVISGKETARKTVDAIMRNEKEIFLPSMFAILYRLLETFPASWQDWMLLVPVLMFSRKKNL